MYNSKAAGSVELTMDLIRERIAQNLALVEQRLAGACDRSGRKRTDITLVAVSKTRSPEEILAAYACGVRHFGENRVEELQAKVAALSRLWSAEQPEWHMIGHLQSRKAREAAALCDMLHSLDSLALAGKLDRQASQRALPLPVLVECNVSHEMSKYGFSAWDPDAWPTLAVELGRLVESAHLSVRGLMTMAPIVAEPHDARQYFSRLRGLREFLRQAVPGIGWHELSMGMTDDYEVAIEEGATMVRIGRAIFN